MTEDEVFALCVPEPNSGCWLALLKGHPDGYAVPKRKDGRIGLHRRAWAARNGPIPEGLSVLHRCDVPCCCNPDHLFVGTTGDNMRDRTAKGRGPRGTRNRNVKLTVEQVLAIREDPRTLMAIAADYGVKFPAICKIKTRRTWGHL